jgi:DNA-binding MarR family transcriptional regulator
MDACTPADGPRDSVDRLLSGWTRARPDLDLSPVAVIERLERLRRIIDAELEATFAEHELNGADFATLVTLRRLDQPGGVSQRQLMRELNLSSGTVSTRVERLSDRGLVTRAVDASDRRNSLVTLTDSGRGLFDRVTPAHVATENRLLSALSEPQRDQLVATLRTLLVSLEGSTCDGAFPQLGLVLAPAHVTFKMRREVGLPDIVGLLVRELAPGGRAADGGIQIGDVLVSAGERELRSITALYAAINDSRHSGVIALHGVRGVDTDFDVTLDLHPRPDDEPPPGDAAPPHGAAKHAL